MRIWKHALYWMFEQAILVWILIFLLIQSELFSYTIFFNPLGSLNFQISKHQDLEVYLIIKGLLFPWSIKWINGFTSSIYSSHWFIFCCLTVKAIFVRNMNSCYFFFFTSGFSTLFLFPWHGCFFFPFTLRKRPGTCIMQSFVTLYHFLY